MRWIKEAYVKDGWHEWRQRSAFLFFPKGMINKNGDYETRWLEYVTWKEKYVGRGDDGTDYWAHQEWLDK